MRRLATGLLGVALLIFIIALLLEPRYPWLGFVRATAEASLVGGLADWFAVTALFRKPMGLPIPHTAIIPTQKDRIGRILGGFLQNHFLSRDVLVARLGSLFEGSPWIAAETWPGRPFGSADQLHAALCATMRAAPEERQVALKSRVARFTDARSFAEQPV